MDFLSPLKSFEIVLCALAFALFAARCKSTAIKHLLIAFSLGCAGAMLASFFIIKAPLPMTATSLGAMIATGLFVTFNGKIVRKTHLLFGFVYGGLTGLTAYEILIHSMSISLVVWTFTLIAAIVSSVAVLLNRRQRVEFQIATRVVASWIAAAGILMISFFF